MIFYRGILPIPMIIQNHSPLRHRGKGFQQFLYRPIGTVAYHRFRTYQRMEPNKFKNGKKSAINLGCF